MKPAGRGEGLRGAQRRGASSPLSGTVQSSWRRMAAARVVDSLDGCEQGHGKRRMQTRTME